MIVRIFEGIATSGKTSLTIALKDALPEYNVVIYGEDQTHIPIKDARKELHMQFFFDLLDNALESNADLVLFDRLYITQAFRANVPIAMYRRLEERLQRVDAETIVLEISEDSLYGRLKNAMEHRDPAWKDYVISRTNSLQQTVKGYAEQQRKVHEYAELSALPVEFFNTTEHDYVRIASSIRANLPLF
jgi:thymidylate kinase